MAKKSAKTESHNGTTKTTSSPADIKKKRKQSGNSSSFNVVTVGLFLGLTIGSAYLLYINNTDSLNQLLSPILSTKTNNNEAPNTQDTAAESKQKTTSNEQEQSKTNREPKPKPKKEKTKKKDKLSNAYDKKISSQIKEVESLLSKSKHRECVTSVEKLMKKYSLSPKLKYIHAQCLDKLAESQRSNDLLKQAIDAYEEVVDKPDCPVELMKETLMTKSKRQVFLGHSAEASKTLSKLVDLLPKELVNERIKALNELGISYMIQGRNKRAMPPFREVLQLDKDNGVAKVHIGFIIKAETKYEESIPYLLEGIRSGEPSAIDSRFFFHLGDAYYRTGQRDKAMEIYKEGAERNLFPSAEQRSTYNAETKLRAQPWWSHEDTGYEKYIKILERNWKMIRDEALAIIDKDKNSFPLETEDLLDKGDWRQFDLYSQGRKQDRNCEKVPKTCALLTKIPDATGNKRGQIKYSIMQPGTHVWPHTGPTNCRLRMHLGLVIPKGVHIRVGKETKTWKNGKVIIIDDSFDHEVWHNGTEARMIFIIDFWHPDIPQWERRKLSPI